LFGVVFPEVVEITFLKKGSKTPTSVPRNDEKLDQTNNRNAPEIKLDHFWTL
jgi:hypothetical protein